MIATLTKRLLEKLSRKTYRAAYVADHIRTGIAYQIRALREQRGWNKGQFAQELGKPQSVTFRFEDPDYGRMTLKTLLEIAASFDVALLVRFVSFPEFLRWNKDVSPDAFKVESFNPADIEAANEAITRNQAEDAPHSSNEVSVEDFGQNALHFYNPQPGLGSGGVVYCNSGSGTVVLGPNANTYQHIVPLNAAHDLQIWCSALEKQPKRNPFLPPVFSGRVDQLVTELERTRRDLDVLRSEYTKLKQERDLTVARLNAVRDDDTPNEASAMPAFIAASQRAERFN